MAKLPPPALLNQANFTPYLIRVDLNSANCLELARRLSYQQPLRHPRLVVDCQGVRCLRTHGVAHLISQLLLLHAAGAQVLLLNVERMLLRCLRLLRLDQVFQISPAGAA